MPVRVAGHSLVRLLAAALSHLDTSIADGTFAIRPTLPYIGGVEGYGEIVESDSHKPGTRVLIRGAGVGSSSDGCWAGYASVPDAALLQLDAQIPAEIAASFSQPCSTAHVALHDLCHVTAADTVLIRGIAGSVGIMAAQIALRAGASVTGTVTRAEQLERVPSGVEQVLVEGPDSPAVTPPGNIRATILIDTLGGPQLGDFINFVEPGGRAAIVGYTLGDSLTLRLSEWIMNDVVLHPVNMIRMEERGIELTHEYAQLLADGMVHLPVQKYAFADISTGLDALTNGKVNGRAVVIMDQIASGGTA